MPMSVMGGHLQRTEGHGLTVAEPASGDVRLELVAEAAQGRGQGRDGRRAQRADGGLPGRPGDPRADVVGDVHQERQIAGTAMAVEYAREDALQPSCAL